MGGATRVNAQTAPVNQTAAPSQTASPTAAPPELTEALSKIDAAASQGNLQAVMGFYSPAFTNSDGLTHDMLQQALTKLWERYPHLTYKTQLNSWKADGNAIVAETTTTIAGRNIVDGRTVNLTATITSRQQFEAQKIVKQEILAEQSQLTSGQKPPIVKVDLPDKVSSGQSFDFDAIVTEPLGDRLLLGAAMDEPVAASSYVNSTPINLELLSAGGLFKVGSAPATPGNRWVSAIIVRDDGITAITQRLAVVPRTGTTIPSPAPASPSSLSSPSSNSPASSSTSPGSLPVPPGAPSQPPSSTP